MFRPLLASRNRLKSFLAILAFSFIALSAKAEDSVYGSLQIGLNLGRFSTSGPQENRRGIIFGGGIEIPLGGNYYLQPEMNYIEKGGRSDLNSINALGAEDVFVKYDFVDIPLLFKARFGESDFRVEVLGGPYFGFAITKTLVVQTTTATTSSTAQLAGTDYGAILGVGADFKVSGDSSVFFTGRYMLGLADASAATTTSSTSTAAATAVNNRGIVLALGYKIPI